MNNNEQNAPLVPHFRIWLCGAFRVERRAGDDYEVLRTVEWGGSSYPRLLLKALVCCPGRQARREALLEMLWPDTDVEHAVQNLNTATSKLRNVLRPVKGQESLLLTENDATVYRLQGQQVLWVDVDEALILLKEAELLGRTSSEALHLLEEATRYLNKSVLQDEDGLWVTGRQATVDQIRYRSRLWLVEAYEQQKRPGQAETLLNTLLEEDPFDEDILCRLLNLLHQQGMTHQALKLYSSTCDVFAKEGLQPTEATRALVVQMHEKRHYTLQTSADLVSSDSMMSSLRQANPDNTLPLWEDVFCQGKPKPAVPGKQEPQNDKPSRRTVLSSAIALPVAMALSQYDLELLQRFSRALSKPSHLDTLTLAELQTHTQSFWHHRLQATFSSTRLLSSVRTHFSLLTDLLQEVLSLSERRAICTLGSETAQIIGMLLFDVRAYEHARNYFHLAIRAAQEAENPLLEIVAWGNLSFAWTYDDHPQQALLCIQEARRLAFLQPDIPHMIQAELAAREAEVFSLLGEQDACLDALSMAEEGVVPTDPALLTVGIHFDLARWAGYQGACLRRLACSQKHAGQKTLLQQAEQALQTALLHVPASQLLRRSTVELDLAEVLLQEENGESATQHALQAASITQRTGSHMMTQRLGVFRQHLGNSPTAYAQAFDAHYALLQPWHEKDKVFP
ncbi:MAG TPA: BTAD domain-containing putative transcriptional regulator [Ktedonobacteraceae bacterium]|nr:BTAD domain-containing putative transcriptional regulator [Ktedonobacteraceae bacterium]